MSEWIKTKYIYMENTIKLLYDSEHNRTFKMHVNMFVWLKTHPEQHIWSPVTEREPDYFILF